MKLSGKGNEINYFPFNQHPRSKSVAKTPPRSSFIRIHLQCDGKRMCATPSGNYRMNARATALTLTLEEVLNA
jgi:hypothetical protein